MLRYLVVYEKTKTGYSSYAPDLPGCVATGRTRRACEKNMAAALELHIEGMRQDGETLPPQSAFAEVMVMAPKPRRSA